MMYLNHFGLREAPFRITPHTDFFFSGGNRGPILDALEYAALHEEGIIKVTGAVGSGKTMLCRMLFEQLPPHVVSVYLSSTSLSREEILNSIADDLGIQAERGRNTALVRALQEHLIALYREGKRVVLLIDEAHALPLETLEEIRLLSNLESSRHKLLQIVLFGQEELDEALRLPQMRQLRERITQSFVLLPLPDGDVPAYLNYRLHAAGYQGGQIFSPGAIKRIARASYGLTRRINILADKCLLAAYTDGSNSVSPRHARLAVQDAGFSGNPTWRHGRPERRRSWWTAMLLTLLGIALGAALTAAILLWRP